MSEQQTFFNRRTAKRIDLSIKPTNLDEKRGQYIFTVLVDRGVNIRSTQAEFLGISTGNLSDILTGQVKVTDHNRKIMMDKLNLTQLEWDTMSYVPSNQFACQRRLGKSEATSILDFIKQPYAAEEDRERMLWLVGKAIQHNITDIEELASFMSVPEDRLFSLMLGEEADDLWFSFACKCAFGESYG